MLVDGIDPRVERAKAKVQKRPAETFGTFATTLVDDIEEGFKNAKHRQQWRNTLRPAIAARALEFTILNAARSGEARGMTWTEVDLEQEIWTVPASRMKAEVVHQVPLSDAATAILAEMKEDDSSQGGRKTSAWNSPVKAGRERARPSA